MTEWIDPWFSLLLKLSFVVALVRELVLLEA